MNYLETMKNIVKNKEKRVSNLILLVVLLVVILISANYIFKDDSNKSTKTNNNSNNTSSSNNINNSSDDKYHNLESKISNILSQVQGISEVSVVLSYSEDSKQNIVYDSKEQIKDGETITEKTVAYNEQGSNKSAIVESVGLPKVEGAIVVAKGANSVELRSKIATAVSTVANIPVYKVQVFEKQG